MAIKERLLSAITSVANADFLRIVTNDGASRKATVSDVAKQMVENYTGSSLAGSTQSVKSALDSMVEQDYPQKSSLTTSDYIRVVGSNNVSYKQLVSDVAKKIIEDYTGSSLAGSKRSVKSALDTLNSNTFSARASSSTSLQSGTDLDTLGRGMYHSTGSAITSTLLNCPITSVAFRLIVMDSGYGSDNLIMQIALTGASAPTTAMYYRKKLSGGWSAWYRVEGVLD